MTSLQSPQTLESVIERQATPEAAPSINAIVASDRFDIPGRFPSSFLESTSTMGDSLSVLYPALPQPSPPQKSGNFPTKETATGSLRGALSAQTSQSSPTKQYPTSMSAPSSSFEFRFARPSAELGTEAQKMMDDLREEALKIKQRLEQEQSAAQDKNAQISAAMYGRKIATPKGRFSDAHSNEFGKMRSIANDPSLQRMNRPAVSTIKLLKPKSAPTAATAATSRPQPISNGHRSLKRTNTMAGLNTEAQRQRATDDNNNNPNNSNSDRPERPGPGKRPKMSPIKEDPNDTCPGTGSRIPRSKSGLPSFATTPTAASLARSQSAKLVARGPHSTQSSPIRPSVLASPLRSCLTPSRPTYTTNNTSSSSAVTTARPSVRVVEKALPAVPRFGLPITKARGASSASAFSSPVKKVSFLPCAETAGRAPPVTKAAALRARFSDWVHRHDRDRKVPLGGSGSDAKATTAGSMVGAGFLIPERMSSAGQFGMKVFGEVHAFDQHSTHIPTIAGTGMTPSTEAFTFRAGAGNGTTSGIKPVVFGPGNRARTIRAVRPSGVRTPTTPKSDFASVLAPALEIDEGQGMRGSSVPPMAHGRVFEGMRAPLTPVLGRKRGREEIEGECEGEGDGRGGRGSGVGERVETKGGDAGAGAAVGGEGEERQRKRLRTMFGGGGGGNGRAVDAKGSRIPMSERKTRSKKGLSAAAAAGQGKGAGSGTAAAAVALKGISLGRLNALAAPKRR